MKKSTHFFTVLLAAFPVYVWPHSASANTEMTPHISRLEDKNNPNWQIFPDDHLYPTKIGDNKRVTFAAQRMWVSESTLPNIGEDHVDLKVGGRLGIFRYSPETNPAYGIQFSVEMGFHGIFDNDNSLDNIGWDGVYAISTEFRYHKTLTWLFGVHHTSSHLGDEYAERIGRQRIEYTRNELRGGVNWQFQPDWQVYAEVGWGYKLGNDVLQMPWRAVGGAQYETLFKESDTLGWYMAANIETYEELDWKLDNTLQAGLVYRSGMRSWRLGIEFYDGRFPLGEFFQDEERYLGLGIWCDI